MSSIQSKNGPEGRIRSARKGEEIQGFARVLRCLGTVAVNLVPCKSFGFVAGKATAIFSDRGALFEIAVKVKRLNMR